ncbi:hypothetical protein ACT009_16585 [Sphingomonas sp. Tas61C01]|uniref:hypothetical protein n=1 Tax=Sphingomonas sp. Tas61C01 TaxID=3458297 RepID=UPI00403E6C4C
MFTAPPADQAAPPVTRRRRWPSILAILVGIALVLLLAMTSRSPWVAARGTVIAEQVGAGRAAVAQLQPGGVPLPQGNAVRFGRAELDGIGALVSNGFEPDRLALEVRGGVMTVTASRPLWFGRWLNLQLVTDGTSKGFPPIRLRFGSIDLSPAMSRRVVDLLRYAANRRGLALPPLDKLVRSVTVGRDAVGAIIALPPRDMLANRIAKLEKDPVDSVAVKRLYCGLAAAQRRYPSDDLARHVNRAFAGAAAQANPAAYNRAAFVALAMLLVDPRAGDLAGGAQAATASCRIEPVVVAIHGRADLSKHWALSAALSAGAGGQLAQALGEWKELADSLAQQSEFAVGDPTGFSFVDLSADRSGFTIAQAAADPDNAARIGALLARATPANILPESLLSRRERLTNADFIKRYGSVQDPRYAAMVAGIDAVLAREAIR